MSKILILPGDGIGIEVTDECIKILNYFKDTFEIEFEKEIFGGASIDKNGQPLTQEVLDKALTSDAVLLGAVGGEKWESIDHNLKPLSWWISKHNSYANKEVFQIVNDEFLRSKKQTKNSLKSDEKKYIFYRVPIVFRSFLYFIFRYFFCLGFLDGFKGFCFHFMQGFWYRLLVDIKYLEVKNKIKENKLSIKQIIKTYLLIDIDNL